MDQDIETMHLGICVPEFFSKFPKVRTDLPLSYQQIYEEAYHNNRKGASVATGISSRLEKWMHYKVGGALKEAKSILEVGAGTLNHIPFELNYGVYDIIEPFESFIPADIKEKGVRFAYHDISEVPRAELYDKILSVAVLEHVLNLPALVAQCILHLSPKGVFAAGIPSEGEPLWKLAYSLSTGIEFYFKYGLRYSVIMEYEHVNTSSEIERVLKFFFKNVRREVFGLSRSLSFYQYFLCDAPNREFAIKYLEQMGSN